MVYLKSMVAILLCLSTLLCFISCENRQESHTDNLSSDQKTEVSTYGDTAKKEPINQQEGAYPIMSMKIEGIDLKDFYLLQPTDKNIKKLIPELLKDILKYYGYEPERRVDITEGAHYFKMVIDDSVAPMHYGYKIENGDLILFAGGAYSMKFAVQDFIKLIRTGQQNRKELTLQNGDTVTPNLLDNPDGLAKPANSGLRLMSCNVLATFWDDSSAAEGISFDMRTEIFKSYLQVFDPDVIGLQEVCNDWLSCLQTISGDGSTWKLATGGGERIYFVNPILYRADRYQLVTEGWINYSQGNSQAWGGRYMTWAVLESISTGERFALVNVHWSGHWLPELNAVQATETLAKLKELQSTYNCQVCITGDFNTADFIAEKKGDATVPNPDISHAEYTYLLADGTVKDAKFYAEMLVNDIGSVHAYGATAYPRTWSYDHIFCTADTTVRQFYTAWDNHQQFASDHAWVIADIDLSVKKSK